MYFKNLSIARKGVSASQNLQIQLADSFFLILQMRSETRHSYQRLSCSVALLILQCAVVNLLVICST